VPVAIARSLRHRRAMHDETFDQVFPSSQRFRSWLHWTSVDVAVRAAAWLAPNAHSKVLDVGAGVGKLCLIGAAITDASWFGIERDLQMVRAANTAAVCMQIADRARFVHGNLASIDWSMFSAFYMYNPFAEMLLHGPDDSLARRDRYEAEIDFVRTQMARTERGTRVVTYHGFGGELPSGFELVHRESARDGELCLWIHRPR
jgi:SAM-dependent methyltransferase